MSILLDVGVLIAIFGLVVWVTEEYDGTTYEVTMAEYENELNQWHFCWREVSDNCSPSEYSENFDEVPDEYILVIEHNPHTGEYRRRPLEDDGPETMYFHNDMRQEYEWTEGYECVRPCCASNSHPVEDENDVEP